MLTVSHPLVRWLRFEFKHPQPIRLRLAEFKLRTTSVSSTVRESWAGFRSDRQNDRLCLFAHFDVQGRIDPWVIFHIRELAAAGFDVALVSTSSTLDSADIEVARSVCRLVVHRTNIGLDFASWKAGLDLLPDAWEYRGILITNDSIFGPFRSMKLVMADIDRHAGNVIGMTDSYEKHVHHLQSYFVYFKKPVLDAVFFKDFWRKLRLYLDKEKIIDRYEIGVSELCVRNGFPIHALYEYWSVKRIADGVSDFQYRELINIAGINSTIFMWDLLLQAGFPYLKTEILKINRMDSRQLPRWKELIPVDGRPLIPMIESFLRRTKPDASGLLLAPLRAPDSV